VSDRSIPIPWKSFFCYRRGHPIIGDVPALLLIAIVLAVLMRAGSSERATAAAAA